MLTGLVKDLVEQDMGMLSEWKGCEVIELNVQADHVHLVVSIPPKVAICELMAGLPVRYLERQTLMTVSCLS